VSDAWEIFTRFTPSDTDPDADAWTQMVAQEIVHIGPILDADVPIVAMTVDMATVLSANLVVDEVSASVDAALTTSTQSTILEADVCQQ
jgi:hypothetical protein